MLYCNQTFGVNQRSRKLKLVDEPFQSDDPIMRTCHESAVKKDGGIVVYSDPTDEVLAAN